MKKLDYIDALRAFAILGVVMVHCTQYGAFDVPDMLRNTAVSGAFGVQLFYIASAFTLFLSFDSRSGNELYPVRNFFIRRFFRIAPLYYIGILYYLWQGGLVERSGWVGAPGEVSPVHILTNATFVLGFNPYWIETIVPGSWSIAIEMIFYAILPFLVMRIRNISHAFNFLLITLIIRTVLVSMLEQHSFISNGKLWGEYMYLFFPSQLPVFALGILLYYIIKEEKDHLKKITGQSMLVLATLIIFNMITPYEVFPRHIIFGIGFFFLALALSKYRPKLVVNPVFGHIGKISFSLYLIHFAVLHWMKHFNLVNYTGNDIVSYFIRFVIVVVIAGIISTIFYHTIEVPFQRIGKNLIKALEKRKGWRYVDAPVVDRQIEKADKDDRSYGRLRF